MLKILGTTEECILLTPVASCMLEYGGSNLEYSTAQGRIYFRLYAKNLQISSLNEYILESLLQKCNIINTSYTLLTKLALVCLYYISIILDNISIQTSDSVLSNIDRVYF